MSAIRWHRRFALGALATMAALSATTAQACGTRANPHTEDYAREHSDVVLTGTLIRDIRSDGAAGVTGKIVPDRIERGDKARSFVVTDQIILCSPWQSWSPSAGQPRRIVGKFYLHRYGDGTFMIVSYEP